MHTEVDVIIGGAGPVGLFLACELGMRGISVLVLETDPNPNSNPWKTKPLGSRGMNTLSVQAFYRRGLLAEVFDSGKERPTNIVKTSSFQFGGHFAGILLDANKIDLSRWKYTLPGPALLPGRTDLHRIGTVLTSRAEQYGINILRGVAITNFTQDNERVTVQTTTDTSYRAKYLVGCDGGRSTVRKLAGFEFVGTEPEFTGYSALCELSNSEKLKPGFQVTHCGMYILGLLGQVTVLDFDGAAFDRTQAVTRDHFENVLRRVSGSDVKVNSLAFASTWTDRALQATTYRKDRILLAGDSAHIHSPLGAQGLNTGIGDAMNLGWKLAATIKNIAPDNLLDTYTQERHPIAAWVLQWTRAQVTILKPTPFGQATATIVRDLINTNDGTNYFADRLWGLSQRYDLGNDHPLVGASVPDFEFLDGSRLGSKMETGRGLLVDFRDNSALAELVRGWEADVEYVNLSVKNELDLQALIVRPDGIVAWVAEENIDQAAAKAALLSWFGEANK